MVHYARPVSLDEALALAGAERWKILAGGTDFYPAQGTRPVTENILDINGLAELRGISDTAAHIVIGARTTWTDIVRAELPPAFDALQQAGREVGSVQIQNTGTIAGNLCNASPAADGVPALLVLDAEVELASAAGRRHLPLVEFIRGNRDTALRRDELMTAVRIPRSAVSGSSSFVKLGARRYLVISIAMAAARIDLSGEGRIAEAAIAVGACSAVAQRLGTLEQAIMGEEAATVAAELPDERHFAGLSPIDDVRGTADYRRHAAREIVRRAVERACADAEQFRERAA